MRPTETIFFCRVGSPWVVRNYENEPSNALNTIIFQFQVQFCFIDNIITRAPNAGK